MLTTASDVAAKIVSPQPVDDAYTLEAVVTAVISHSQQDVRLAFADTSGACLARLNLRQTPILPRPGDRARICGHLTTSSLLSNECWIDDLTVLTSTSLPPPPDRSIADALDGKHDWQRMRVRGLVRNVLQSETAANWAILILCDEHDILYAAVPLYGHPIDSFKELIGRTVELEGFPNPRDGSLRIYMGRIFHCPSLDHIHPIPTSGDPFDVPDVSTLRFRRAAEIAALGPVKAKGRVVSVWGEGNLILAQASGEPVQAVCRDHSYPKRGESVEIVGLPLSDLFHITLTQAIWRKTDDQPVVSFSTLDLTAEDILTEHPGRDTRKINLLGREIRLQGHIRNLPEDGVRGNILLLENGPHVVPVDVGAVRETARKLELGAEIAVTGTCIFETENWRTDLVFPQIHGFRIIVNTPDGLVLLRRPPWWTSGRLTALIALLLAALAAIFLWNRALNREANRRGQQLLREELGHLKADLKTTERTRLAVELHDSLAQSLTGVSMEIETAERFGLTDSTSMMAHLATARRSLKSCRLELRNTLWDLRNQSLDEEDMDTAIRRALLPHVKGVSVSIRSNIPRSFLSDNVTHEILRIIRELVINAIAHGHATKIRIAGSSEGRTILFAVKDNGTGFDPHNHPGAAEGHFGIQGITERLKSLKGTLVFDSVPGRGTKAIVTLSIEKDAEP